MLAAIMVRFSCIFLGLIVLLGGCKSDIKKVERIASKKAAQTEKVYHVTIKYKKNGLLRAKVKAPKMIRHITKEPYTEMPEGLKLLFYNPDLSVKSTLTANYGVNYQNDKEMLVRDDVQVINKKGEKLNAEELIWDEKREEIYTDKFVKITTKDEIIYGEGLVANQDLTNYKIKDIKGTINMDKAASDTAQKSPTAGPS